MTEIFEQFMPKWPPTGLSHPTRVSGDMHPAVVAFTDTPELFGGEIRIPFRAVLAKSLAGQVFARESR
jgi:hypothetical protein